MDTAKPKRTPRQKAIADVQNLADKRHLAINKVGIKGIRHPVVVRDKSVGVQHTVATFNMYVHLPHNFKGTHMSRFVEILNSHEREISVENFPVMLQDMIVKLEAETGHIEMNFPYFINKKAPVTGSQGLMEYECTIKGSLNSTMDLMLIIHVPISTLCPCSKEISKVGAHNQRGEVRIQVRYKKFFWIEDLIRLVEESASCEVYALLKRQDEKYVTEKAYTNPMFVEDVVREIAHRLSQDDNFSWYAVESENFESIHNHSAYALIECDKTKGKGGRVPACSKRAAERLSRVSS